MANIKLVEQKEIRSVWNDADQKRYFVVEDVAALTDNEWKQRGVKEGKEYSILTAEISKATFGLAPRQYRKSDTTLAMT